MRYNDAIFAALGAIRVNMLRSALTALGIIIGVAAVIVMISVGAGAQKRVDDFIKTLGANLVLVVPGTTTWYPILSRTTVAARPRLGW